jgi:hypothetical protein
VRNLFDTVQLLALILIITLVAWILGKADPFGEAREEAILRESQSCFLPRNGVTTP